MKHYEIWIRESLTGKEGLVEIRNQLSIPKKSSDGFYQHLKMKKISPLNYPHPNFDANERLVWLKHVHFPRKITF